MSRRGQVARQTKETNIALTLELDGTGQVEIATGIPFLDHMLHLWAAHGFFDLEVTAAGDLEIDDHHTVEDVGICLGQAFRQALVQQPGFCRYGFASVPMDEALAQVSVDLSNRPLLVYKVSFLPGGQPLRPSVSPGILAGLLPPQRRHHAHSGAAGGEHPPHHRSHF